MCETRALCTRASLEDRTPRTERNTVPRGTLHSTTGNSICTVITTDTMCCRLISACSREMQLHVHENADNGEVKSYM